ncbi:MAG: phosphoglucosamine mutase [Gammaproteobacteria bacterium]|nr:phosphoglucosamine mutase [Gammaproteobacteria bacterium]
MRKFFGTDGIRGRVGEAPITPDFLLRLGWAAGRVFASEGQRKVLIGKDTRISGYMLESVLEAGLSAAGVDVHLLGPMPTPAIAYLTRTFRADAGIVISGSHNPYYDNGIKFFDSDGNKLPDSMELAIEAELATELETVESERLGKAYRIDDAPGRYIEYCKASTGNGFRLHGLKIVLDCANGATYHIAPSVFGELGAEVFTTGADPDGFNINAGCGAMHPQPLANEVLRVGGDVGIAFDGDGDRVIMIDHRGQVVDGDQLLYVIAAHRKSVDRVGGGIVGTEMSNLGLERALSAMKIPFVRSRVGDRYVLEELIRRDWILGGESSGHIICRDVSTTGDGIVSALQTLAAMAHSGESLQELTRGMQKLPQTMVNVPVASPKTVSETPRVREAVADAEANLGDRGRVLLRASGTEPVVRVMVEGEDAAEVSAVADELADVVRVALG